MSSKRRTSSSERVELLRWVLRIGAVTAEALAHRDGLTVASSRARLGHTSGAGLLLSHRPLTDRPALYTATESGVRLAGLAGLDRCRVSASGAQHLIACAHVAAALERAYPRYEVIGERELRRRERASGELLASVTLRHSGGCAVPLHRPDLVLLPPASAQGRPVAVEVELTVKAPRRLGEICRGWARARHVEAVLYIAPTAVASALERAIALSSASDRIVVLSPEALTLGLEG